MALLRTPCYHWNQWISTIVSPASLSFKMLNWHCPNCNFNFLFLPAYLDFWTPALVSQLASITPAWRGHTTLQKLTWVLSNKPLVVPTVLRKIIFVKKTKLELVLHDYWLRAQALPHWFAGAWPVCTVTARSLKQVSNQDLDFSFFSPGLD